MWLWPLRARKRIRAELQEAEAARTAARQQAAQTKDRAPAVRQLTRELQQKRELPLEALFQAGVRHRRP